MEQTPVICSSQSVKAALSLAMPRVGTNEQWSVEKHLFRLSDGHSVLLILAGVSCVPVESADLGKIDHICILR